MHAHVPCVPAPTGLGTCALMVHHGFDKIQNVDGFSANVVAKFFGFLPGPPQFWTLSAAATQIIGAGLLGVGAFSRPTAAAMSATMLTAVIFHLLNTGGESFPLGIPKAHSYNFELAAMCKRDSDLEAVISSPLPLNSHATCPYAYRLQTSSSSATSPSLAPASTLSTSRSSAASSSSTAPSSTRSLARTK